ncbi:hypothetical protein F2P79_007037 [Pimephales promelas]|nr:hypothetical protein F2P79_007037 [Pimephales promelas]
MTVERSVKGLEETDVCSPGILSFCVTGRISDRGYIADVKPFNTNETAMELNVNSDLERGRRRRGGEEEEEEG